MASISGCTYNGDLPRANTYSQNGINLEDIHQNALVTWAEVKILVYKAMLKSLWTYGIQLLSVQGAPQCTRKHVVVNLMALHYERWLWSAKRSDCLILSVSSGRATVYTQARSSEPDGAALREVIVIC
jgi:hypothetical protein